MKQASEPIFPEISNNFVSGDEITEEEMTAQLQKSYKGAIMLMSDKKKFLLCLLENKKDLIDKCRVFDSIIPDSSLYAGVSSLLPANNRIVNHDSKNSDLALMIAKLLPPLKLLQSYLVAEYKEEQKRKSQLRSSTQGQKKPCPVKVLLDDSLEIYKKIELAVKEERSVPTIQSFIKKKVKLTPFQRQRKFDIVRVPVAKQLQFCANCGHKSTNLPVENDEIKEFNKKKADDHAKSTKLWDDYLKKVTSGDKDVRMPSGMSRRPNKRNFKEPIIMCMCASSFCLGNFDTSKNGCPIKCLKNKEYTNQVKVKVEGEQSLAKTESSTEERYEFAGNPKACTCPICACHCSFACRVVDVPSILLQKAIEAKDQKDSFNSKDTFNQNSEECQPFLQNIMKDAMLMCMKTIKKAEKNENLNTYKFKPELHERIENRGVTMSQCSSEYCVSFSEINIEGTKGLEKRSWETNNQSMLTKWRYF